jgi:hypothetical protein
MKRTTAVNLTILVGIILLVGGPASGLMIGPWNIFGMLATAVGLFVGGLLIAVGVYIRLQSMSIAPAVPVTRLCPQCGRNNLPTNKYCDKCGAKLSTEGP